MKKRKIWSGAITACLLIALAAAAAVALPQEGGQSPRKTMQGSWKVTVTPGQSPVPLPPTFESVVTYVPGGGLLESDNLAVPGSIAGTGQGVWEYAGRRQFTLTFTKYLFTTQGLFMGSGKIRESISLSAEGDEYSGEGTMEILNPAGGVIFTVPLTTRGVRVRAEGP